ncbi:hypothetical protein ACFXJ8_06300 [Nonomuraea sp. NPDC059194]|uniref:hypothetical protein n=1 Tax=Nonomuraea sp. NPDC059194 TaxID=3346764 RepID=UPI00367EDED5
MKAQVPATRAKVPAAKARTSAQAPSTKVQVPATSGQTPAIAGQASGTGAQAAAPGGQGGKAVPMADAALTGAGQAQGLWGDPKLRLPQVAPDRPNAGANPPVRGVPLPRELAVSPERAQAAGRTDLTEGLNGLPYMGGGLLLLLGGLWGVARAQRSRSIRKTQLMS